MLRVGFDVGGTFTDFVLQTDDGHLRTGKRLTTYPDPSEACLAGLDQIMHDAGASWADLSQAVHGTTLGSNLVIERKGRDVALVTTRGFRDVLLIGRQKRYDVYNLQIDKPGHLVDRASTYEVTERLLADGSVRTPLDEEEARVLIRRLADQGIASIAVCFLHSYLNDRHERRFAELVADEAQDMIVSLSSDVAPQFREYERTSTTVVNAYLIRAVRDYLTRMQQEFQVRGFQRQLFIMQSSGGIAAAATMTEHPVRMLESGPAAGALIAARYGELTDNPDLVAFDMGGTTAKLSLITDSTPQTTGSFELHRTGFAPGSGIPINVRSIDLVEIGAGGGSIARADMRTIQVGPESAGADPGPACYGLGGTAPTVTDANLVLGYLNPDRFAGGTMILDLDAASEAIERDVAKPLGMNLEEAAWGIHRLVNLNMELATRVVSIERGYDPRQLAFVATGGSGPVHGWRLASALGIRTVILPAAAGVASAIGLLAAPPRFDVSQTYVVRLDELDLDHLAAMFTQLEAEVTEVVKQSTGHPPTAVEREAEVRYVGQGYEVTTAVPGGEIGPDEIAALRRGFDVAYERRYGYANPDERAESTTWRVIARGRGPTVELPRFSRRVDDLDGALLGRRRAYFPEAEGHVETPVYDRELLFPDAKIDGPAIVEERESTSVLPPGARAVVDTHGNLIVEAS